MVRSKIARAAIVGVMALAVPLLAVTKHHTVQPAVKQTPITSAKPAATKHVAVKKLTTKKHVVRKLSARKRAAKKLTSNRKKVSHLTAKPAKKM